MFILLFLLHLTAAYDPAEWKNKKGDMVRAMYCAIFYMIRDEQCQVNGIVFLSDMTGLTLAHQTFWSIDEVKRQMKYWQVRCMTY